MGGVCRVVDAPYVVYRTNVRVDCNLWGVYQEDVQLCLNGGFSKGRVRHHWITAFSFVHKYKFMTKVALLQASRVFFWCT